MKKISFSEWRSFLKCPYEHFLAYVTREPTPPEFNDILFTGSTIHKAIELGIKSNWEYESPLKLFRAARKEVTLEEVRRIKQNAARYEAYNEEKYLNTLEDFLAKTKTTHEEYGARILNALNFKNNFPADEWEVIGAEEEMLAPLVDDIYFKGILDLRLRNKQTGKYLIIDWKSAGKRWDIEKKKKDDSFFAQVFLYQYFISKIFEVDIKNIELAYIVLPKDEVIVSALQKVSVEFDIDVAYKEFIVPLQEDAKKIFALKDSIQFTREKNGDVKWGEKIPKLKHLPKGATVNGYSPFILCKSCRFNHLFCNMEVDQKKYKAIFK